MFHNCQKKPILKIFVSFPRVVCVALATTMGLQCSYAALAEEKAVPSDGDQTPSFPYLLSIPWGASDNTVTIPSLLPAPCTVRDTGMPTRGHRGTPPLVELERPVPDTKLRTSSGEGMPRLHRCSVFKQKGKASYLNVLSASRTQVFKDVRVVVNQGEIGSSVSWGPDSQRFPYITWGSSTSGDKYMWQECNHWANHNWSD